MAGGEFLLSDEMFAWFRDVLAASFGIEVPERCCWFRMSLVSRGAEVSWVEGSSYRAGCGRIVGDRVGELFGAVATKIELPQAVRRMEIILSTSGPVEVSLSIFGARAAESGG